MTASASPSSTSRPHNGQSMAANAFDDVGPRHPQPRPVKELSWELANHSKAYLEAQQYANGYNFLYSLLAAGTSISVPAKPYAGFLAPAAQLALASTLIAYPAVTTKSKSAEIMQGSDAAVRYLRCVQNTIEGPAYRVVKKAFSFPDDRTRRHIPGHRSRAVSPSPAAGADVERLEGVAANAHSLWYRADDFWHILGWAFNCSVAYKKRWERWKLWLQVMLDFLESDWKTRLKAGRDEGEGRESTLQDSLLWQYISSQDPTNRNIRRRMIRAVLAAGTEESLRHYPEVWVNETVEPKPRDKDTERIAPTDVGNGELGGYQSVDEDVIMQDASTLDKGKARSRTSSSASSSSRPSSVRFNADDAGGRFGGMEAIELRQRFIAILVQVAQELPKQFASLEDFLDDLTEELRQLPIFIFSAFVSTSRLSSLAELALNANLLLPLATGQLPNYTKIVPTQSHFETYWLRLRGNTQSFAASAKISLTLERMLMYMMNEHLLKATDCLREAMECGIEARHKVYGTGKGKTRNPVEEEKGKEFIEASSERLLGLLEVLEIASGKELQPRKEKSKPSPLFSSFASSLSAAPESETEEDD